MYCVFLWSGVCQWVWGSQHFCCMYASLCSGGSRISLAAVTYYLAECLPKTTLKWKKNWTDTEVSICDYLPSWYLPQCPLASLPHSRSLRTPDPPRPPPRVVWSGGPSYTGSPTHVLSLYLKTNKIIEVTEADPGFLRGGAQFSGGRQHTILPNFPKSPPPP